VTEEGGTAERSAWDEAIVDLLERAKLAQPDQLVGEVNAATRPLGVEITVYLIDHEQEQLWPLPERGKPTPPPLAVEGTAAGRAFTMIETQSAVDTVTYRLWVPMIDGSERLGVADVMAHRRPDDPEAFRRSCETLMGLIGHLVTVKFPYGDRLHTVRRTRPMSAGSELVLQMLPPLTFSCHRMVVSAVLEPCYDIGGDAYDYAVDDQIARVMVLDAMGRGLSAGLTSAAALAAIRAARRNRDGLAEMARAADTALVEQFPDLRFVTGVLAELDMDAGRLRYLNAGHPAPLLIRGGRVVDTLTGGRRMPIGVADPGAEADEMELEVGDRLLLYTDGVTEARSRGDDDRFGVDRLVELAERCMAERLPAPETLRRLSRTVLAHQGGRPTDDATMLLLEWSSEAAERTQP
jgi:sigma-B regulation protein RsbU (phosphoserine phosphatase)